MLQFGNRSNRAFDYWPRANGQRPGYGDRGSRRGSALRLPGKDPPAAVALLSSTQTTLPLYRISTTRSLLTRACSMRGHSRSKAYPQKTRSSFGTAGEVEEVLIFGHYYGSSLARVLPYFRVGGCVRINGFHVLTLMPEGS
jgi:hypothetical protein